MNLRGYHSFLLSRLHSHFAFPTSGTFLSTLLYVLLKTVSALPNPSSYYHVVSLHDPTFKNPVLVCPKHSFNWLLCSRITILPHNFHITVQHLPTFSSGPFLLHTFCLDNIYWLICCFNNLIKLVLRYGTTSAKLCKAIPCDYKSHS